MADEARSVTGAGLLSALLVVVGCAGLVYFFGMETAVNSPLGGRVNNLGLMADRQNGLIVSAVILVVGVLIALLVKRPEKVMKCPACAEFVKADATICKHCHTKLSKAA